MSTFSQSRRINNAAEFGKVAVVMGGRSAERDVSLRSGNAVLQALQSVGVNALGIDAKEGVLDAVRDSGADRVFIILHGPGGEDGTLQGALETLDVPYTGSGVLGSALGMDKLRSKQLWLGLGLPTPPFTMVRNEADLALARDMEFPVIVKPVNQGSSIGMTKVESAANLDAAWNAALKFDNEVLVEKWITGAEYTASILQGEALPLIRLETPRTFYDYEAKYSANDTRYHCPCGLDAPVENRYQRLALDAFDALGCGGWGRVDFMCDRDGRPWLLEVNTTPGMTDHSLVPMAARAAGLTFEELCWRILETSLGA